MDNLNEKQRDILQCISTAFATVPYPGDDDIIGHECSECERANAVFRGKHWKDYLYSPYELLGYFAPQQPTIMFSRDSLCLLQPKAFLFFLPVFLAGIVIDSKQADVMVDAMPGQFDPGPTSRCKPDLWTWKKTGKTLEKQGMTLSGKLSGQKGFVTFHDYVALQYVSQPSLGIVLDAQMLFSGEIGTDSGSIRYCMEMNAVVVKFVRFLKNRDVHDIFQKVILETDIQDTLGKRMDDLRRLIELYRQDKVWRCELVRLGLLKGN